MVKGLTLWLAHDREELIEVTTYHHSAAVLRILVMLLIAGVVISACGRIATAPATPAAPTATVPAVAPTDLPAITPGTPTSAANLTDGCAETYDPDVDYFPEKMSLRYAEGWTIEYFNNYKVINVLNPWRDADVTFQYVLVQCGTPAPDGFDDAQVIEVPIDTIVTMSTTYLPHLADLQLLDRLVGVSDGPFVSNPTVRDMLANGTVAEVGRGAEVNLERILELDPAVVMDYGSGDAQNDTYPILQQAGLNVALNAEYMETSPLGRAEWIKFTAALFNHEAAAESIFADMAGAYEALAAAASVVAERPTVFTNAPFQGTWYMPGGSSFVARLLADAGADYLWADDDSTGSLPLSFEVVYDRVVDADFWINTSTWTSIDEALAEDERFADFAALQNRQMYNNNARVNENGGNAYWESGVTNPHLILADLIKILHPEVLPDHELYYYRQVR